MDTTSTSPAQPTLAAQSQRPELVLDQLAASLMPETADLAYVFGSSSASNPDATVFTGSGDKPIADAYRDYPKQNPAVNRVTEDIKTHLFLKTSRTLVLGDNHEITCINGNVSDCRIVFAPPTSDSVATSGNNKSAQAASTQDPGAQKTQDSSQAIFSISGIARDVKLKANKFYDKAAASATSAVPSSTLALPSIVSSDLAYGSIAFINSKKIVKLEFLSGSALPGYSHPSELPYANLMVVSDQRLTAANVPLPMNAALQVQDEQGNAQTSTFPIAGLQDIVLPGVVQGDPALSDQYGVNVIDYRKGLGRLNYMWFEGISKGVNYAAEHHRIVYSTFQKTTDLFSPLIYEGTYTAFSANNYTRILNSSQNFYGTDTANVVSVMKLTNTTTVMTCEVGNIFTAIKTRLGCSSDNLLGSKMASVPLKLDRAETLAMRGMLENGTAQSVVESYQSKNEMIGSAVLNSDSSYDSTDSSMTDATVIFT